MLIEVLVALILFSIGLLGFVALQARAITISSDAQDRNRAALLANEMASAMWISGSTKVDGSVLSAWQTKVADMQAGGLPNGNGSVTATNQSAVITIQWKAPARRESDQASRYTTSVVLP
ncbi:MAG: fimbrial assembly protein [Betaproteobacteria bacterium]|nr:fimbrial assembly protein [Betaproteobacteria bacterium]MCL2886033.1 fimbrial assembly protein [Betaproteobacteria bacterium]